MRPRQFCLRTLVMLDCPPMPPPRIPYVDLVAHNAPLKEALLAAVARVLSHGQFINGPEVSELEEKLAAFLGVSQIVGVSNGTDALVMALRLAGVGPGDEVICPSHSFVATASSIRLVGATPVFADLDEQTMNVDVESVSSSITRKTRAVMPVHLNGTPAAVDALAALCERRGLALIEDCAQSIGTRLHGRSVGSLGIGCFSLHPLKVLSALGDAGFISVAKPEHAIALRHMRNIGLVDRDHCSTVSSNTRLDTVHASMVLAKLPHVSHWVDARRAHAAAYRQALSGLVALPPDEGDNFHVYSAFVIRHPKRDALMAFLAERGIETKVHYPIAIHRQKAFADLPPCELPVTDKVVASILSLPVTPELSVEQRGEVIEGIRAFCKQSA